MRLTGKCLDNLIKDAGICRRSDHITDQLEQFRVSCIQPQLNIWLGEYTVREGNTDTEARKRESRVLPDVADCQLTGVLDVFTRLQRTRDVSSLSP